jgi:hypothetical protein
MSKDMSHLPPPPEAERPGHLGRVQPLAYASVMLIVFVTTVIELAVKAGTGTAMFTTLVAIVVAGTVCGLWGTTMTLKQADSRQDVPPG